VDEEVIPETSDFIVVLSGVANEPAGQQASLQRFWLGQVLDVEESHHEPVRLRVHWYQADREYSVYQPCFSKGVKAGRAASRVPLTDWISFDCVVYIIPILTKGGRIPRKHVKELKKDFP
jgi:hypothetical protein